MAARAIDAKEKVLQAAVRAFAAAGYAGTSVQDILKATGLSKPTLYYYFGSKEGLYRAILAFAYDESFRRMQAGTNREGTCAERLVKLAAAVFDFATEHRDLMRLVFATIFAAPGEIPPGVIDGGKRRRSFELARSLVREGQRRRELDPARNPAELTHAIFGAISHQVRMHLLDADGPLDHKRAGRVVDLFLNGARYQRKKQ
jgi:AcrR family transcriptional regulator